MFEKLDHGNLYQSLRTKKDNRFPEIVTMNYCNPALPVKGRWSGPLNQVGWKSSRSKPQVGVCTWEEGLCVSWLPSEARAVLSDSVAATLNLWLLGTWWQWFRKSGFHFKRNYLKFKTSVQFILIMLRTTWWTCFVTIHFWILNNKVVLVKI